MGTRENSIIRDRASRRPIGVSIVLFLCRPRNVEFSPPKEKKRKENWSFASGKGQQLSGFLTETCSIHVRAKRTVVSLSWHPSSHDFVKKFAAMRRTRCFFGKSNTELLCDRTQIVRTLTTWRQETFFKKTLSPLQTFHLLLFPFSIRHFEGKSFDYPVLGF